MRLIILSYCAQSDGQYRHDADHSTKLDIKIWHHARTKKKGRKPHLIGSAYVTLGELLRRQEKPEAGELVPVRHVVLRSYRTADVIVSLKCPPPQKRSPSIGTRQANSATLTVRVRSPLPSPSPSSEAALVASENGFARYEENSSEGTLSDASELCG